MSTITHNFHLFQGQRANDTKFIAASNTDLSVPTQHGWHMMRSQLETLWAARFEQRGFVQAPYGIATPPCYFYEPRGTKRWPGYLRGRHYRIDFILVYEVETCMLESEARSRATRWEWVSIKPAEDPTDLEHLVALVAFDNRHQRAFQCCGHPTKNPTIHTVVYQGQPG